MPIIAIAILTTHFLLLFVLCLFGLHRLSMVLRWFRYKTVKPVLAETFGDLPRLTIQVPLYNERFVAKRITDACAAINYPREKLQIQIVDDSTDDTCDIVAERVQFYRQQGVDIEQIRRSNRQGYKAGALKNAMETATGDFIAIFDADFVPSADLLMDTIGYFHEPKIGMIQFRWEHLNRENSLFTKTQSIMLDAHFALEQQVRYASGMLFNFNGTAGIWRKETIVDAGNWSADTLTEDLDLSYRAQMRGWKMLYLNEVACPGEIPANVNAFKSQQHRWAKGGVQVLLKLIKKIWKSPYSLVKKIESTFHLSNNLAYLVVLVDTLFFLIPSLWIRETYPVDNMFLIDIPLLILASGGHLIYLFFGQVALKRSLWSAFIHLPLLVLLGVQLAFNNARAAIEALRKQQSEFVRTPKSGDEATTVLPIKSAQQKTYTVSLPKSAIVELIVSIIYLAVLVWAAMHEKWLMLPFLLILTLGFMTTAMTNLPSFRPQKNSS